jgi:uncharacterized membrane protein YkvA (DUF1232 family)
MNLWQWILISSGIVLGVYAAFVLALVLAGTKQQARAVAGFIPDCVVLFKRLLGDPRVSRRNRWLLAVMILYLGMPFDVLPDFIPVAGQLDDAIMVAWVLRHVLASTGPALISEHWPGPQESLNVMLRMVG